MTVFRLVVAFVCSLVLVESLSAQTNLQVPLQFDFLDPGARSLAMGGAFTPLADDATAAVTNPAGLTQLVAPEMSFELRGRQLVTPYLRGGRLSGIMTARGIDTVSGPIYADAEDTRVFPSFASFIYPARRVSVAFYARQLVNVRQQFERDGVLGVFTTPGGIVQDAREPPQRVSRRVDIGTGGISAGFRLNDRLAAGIGVSLSRLVIDETSTRYATEGIDIVSLDPVHPSVYRSPGLHTARQWRILVASRSARASNARRRLGLLVQRRAVV